MASRRTLRALAGETLLFGCGAAAAGAWAGRFYASLTLALLVGLWLATLTLLRTLPPRPLRAPPPAPAGRQGDEAAMLRALLDQTPAPLLALGADGRTRALNRSARMLFGTDDLVLAPPAGLATGPRLRIDDRAYRIDRAAIRGSGIEAARTILALTDIEAEERAAEARATRDLLQVLSHEIMNALTPIASLAESAAAAVAGSATSASPVQDMLGTLARRTAALQHFTESYRALARLPAPTLAGVDIAPLLQDVERLFRARWSDRIRLEVKHGGGAARIDREQIGQALWALLQNGAEAAEAGSAPAWVRLEANRSAAMLTFRVTDSGGGVPEAMRERIFSVFTTTKAGGSGVGLSLARQIARGHGGEVVLDMPASDRTGACFALSLPLG